MPCTRSASSSGRRSRGLAAEHADGVERVGRLEDAGARDRAVGRLEAVDAAVGRRAHDRARGLRAERPRHHAGGDRGGGAARRGAGGPREVVRVARAAGLVHAELGGHGLAEHRAAGAARVEDDARVVAGREAAPTSSLPIVGRQVARVEDVLDAERHAVQRSRLRRRGRPPARGRPSTCSQAPTTRVERLDPAQAGLPSARRARLARRDAAAAAATAPRPSA